MSVPTDVIARLAAAPSLLIACDFDGTLADIVPDPDDARPRPRAIEALARLSAMPGVTIAVISGRALRDLKRRLSEDLNVTLVGSHGAEWQGADAAPADSATGALLRRLEAAARDAASGLPGIGVETKPFGIALHYRRASEPDARVAIARFESALSKITGAHVRHGSKVIEASAVSANKGDSLREVRRRAQAEMVVFIGDDRTDEDAFAALARQDIGIKVGEGPTLARHRVANPAAVAEFLVTLAAARASPSHSR